MASVDRDLENVVAFYEEFDSEVLQEIETLAGLLSSAADNIEDILYNTSFATKSSMEIKEIANRLMQAVDQGGQKIKILKKTAEDHVERGKRFTR